MFGSFREVWIGGRRPCGDGVAGAVRPSAGAGAGRPVGRGGRARAAQPRGGMLPAGAAAAAAAAPSRPELCVSSTCQAAGVRIYLSPGQHVELWLALARLETYENARRVAPRGPTPQGLGPLQRRWSVPATPPAPWDSVPPPSDPHSPPRAQARAQRGPADDPDRAVHLGDCRQGARPGRAGSRPPPRPRGRPHPAAGKTKTKQTKPAPKPRSWRRRTATRRWCPRSSRAA